MIDKKYNKLYNKDYDANYHGAEGKTFHKYFRLSIIFVLT